MKKYTYKITKTTILISLLFSVSAIADSGFNPFISNKSRIDQQLPSKKQLIIAYYGRPGTSKLGVLGKYPISTLTKKIKAKTLEYAKVTQDLNITPALEIVHSMATIHPGAQKDYILPLSEKRTIQYIHGAQANGLSVFLDHQLGKKSPNQAIKSMLRYLKYDNVHLAIDPEFAVRGRNIRPGKAIGYITGDDVNKMQASMSRYMEKNNITETKILLLHMFKKRMLKRKDKIKYYPNIKIVMNLDGHGTSAVKIDVYNDIYTTNIKKRFAGGFKLFFERDKPRLMTPSQVMGLTKAQGKQIKHPPEFISYQ